MIFENSILDRVEKLFKETSLQMYHSDDCGMFQNRRIISCFVQKAILSLLPGTVTRIITVLKCMLVKTIFFLPERMAV